MGRVHAMTALRRRAAVCALACGVASAAQAIDPFDVERAVPAVAAGDVAGSGFDCRFGPLAQPLALREAVARALCDNPQTREAWLAVRAQADAVGQGRGAYLPTVLGEVDATRDDAVGDVRGHPELSAATKQGFEAGSVSLSWVLFDFGRRAASLRNADELLAAAQALHDATLQAVFASTAQDYYAAQAAQGALAAAVDTESAARRSVDAASARVDKGVAPITDQLQAQTALAQATYDRAKAAGELQVALGALAVDMNLRPDSALVLPGADEGVQPDAEFDRSVTALMDEAVRTHPGVRAAQAQLAAAVAQVDETRAQGLPQVSFVADSNRNNRAISPSLGQPLYPGTGRDLSFGIKITIPLFAGFSTLYQVRQAQAQVGQKDAALDGAKRQVEQGVWAAYQTVQTATHNLENSARLLQAARASRQATQARYEAGVGSILEALNAESALAAATNQRLHALTDWRASRLQLAGRLGTLGMWRLSQDGVAR